ncbi:MAG: hypothetical protein J0H53_25015 [Rhizobiales bacterium]|nr:hypothetical protein [Hyphomicrobiales bacterium]
MNTHSHAPQTGEPIQLPARRKRSYAEWGISASVAFSSCLLFLALLNLVGGDGPIGFAKAAIMSVGAGLAAYAINRLAIERGAEQATIGYLGAGIISIGSILVVGFGFFAATYPGVVLPKVEDLRLSRHGADLSVFVGDVSRGAANAGRAGPPLRAAKDDLAAKRDCEFSDACVSRRGGGKGAVWQALDALAGRAEAIERQLEAGEETRERVLAALGEAIAEYQNVLGDDSRSIWTRRAELQSLDARIRQQAAQLGEALPLALLSAYAGELKAGITIPERTEATAAVNAITRKHGEALAAVVASIDQGSAAAPLFPKRAGVSDAFDHVAHFLPVAAIAFVVDLVFPAVLWAYTFFGLRWNAYRQQAAVLGRPDEKAPAIPHAALPALAGPKIDAGDDTRHGHSGDYRRNGHRGLRRRQHGNDRRDTDANEEST